MEWYIYALMILVGAPLAFITAGYVWGLSLHIKQVLTNDAGDTDE